MTDKLPNWPLAEKPDGELTVLRADRMNGRVMKLNYEKRYGFIRAARLLDAEYDDYFFHANDMEGEALDFAALSLGDRVSFVPANSSKGARALEVRRER